jgi:hypothetical protein
MGWSTVAMRQRYMHVTDRLRRNIASQLKTATSGRELRASTAPMALIKPPFRSPTWG